MADVTPPVPAPVSPEPAPSTPAISPQNKQLLMILISAALAFIAARWGISIPTAPQTVSQPQPLVIVVSGSAQPASK